MELHFNCYNKRVPWLRMFSPQTDLIYNFIPSFINMTVIIKKNFLYSLGFFTFTTGIPYWYFTIWLMLQDYIYAQFPLIETKVNNSQLFHNLSPYCLRNSPFFSDYMYDEEYKANVTGQQRMLTSPWHLILPHILEEVRVCSDL